MNEHSNKKTTGEQRQGDWQRTPTSDWRIRESQRSSDWYYDSSQRAPRLRGSLKDDED